MARYNPKSCREPIFANATYLNRSRPEGLVVMADLYIIKQFANAQTEWLP
jgi:hypothetical protein